MDRWHPGQAPQQEAGPHQEGVACVSNWAAKCEMSQDFVDAACLPSLLCK